MQWSTKEQDQIQVKGDVRENSIQKEKEKGKEKRRKWVRLTGLTRAINCPSTAFGRNFN